MKEILFIRNSSDNFGGIEGQILRLATEFYSKGLFLPVLVTASTTCTFARRFKENGFDVYQVPFGKSKTIMSARCISDIIACRNIALIQTHMFRESLIARLVCKKNPQIPHVYRAQLHIDASQKNPSWKKFLYHLLDKLTSKHVDYYVANGEYLRDEIVNRSWIKPGKAITVINGRQSLGLPDLPYERLDAPLPFKIAMIANLWTGKGHDVLIKGLSILNNKGIRIEARLIGGELTGKQSLTSPITNDIKAQARKLGVLDQIEFYGHTDDVYSALKGIAVVVLPSDSEGIPNSILEAISLRKLVIASRVGGVPEIIDDGSQGLLHSPRDPDDFAKCLHQVFTTPASKWEPLRNAAYQKWQEKFTMKKMIENLTEIYKKLNALN